MRKLSAGSSVKDMKNPEWSFTPFKGLGDALRKKNDTLRVKDAAKPAVKEQKTDDEIFREAMADVKEITEFKEIPFVAKKHEKPIPAPKDETVNILNELIKGQRRITLSDTPEYIEWVHPHIRKDVAQRLHRGNFSVQDCVDLHGLTIAEAEEVLFDFFRDAVKRRLFCVKVIHGRGLRSPKGPVLKEAVIKWLHGQFSKWVLAYSSAMYRDGGLGATYIILRAK